MEAKPKWPAVEQRFLTNLQEEKGYLEAFLYLFTKTDIFTNMRQAYGSDTGIIPKGGLLYEKYKEAESLFDLIRKVVGLKTKFDSTDIYRYITQDEEGNEPVEKFLANLSIAFRIEHFLDKISPNFPGVQISHIDTRVKEVVKEINDLKSTDQIRECDEYILDCFYKAAMNARKVPPNLTLVQKQDAVIEAFRSSKLILETPEKFCKMLLKGLKSVLYNEQFLNLSLAGTDPLANIISHALCSVLNDDFNLDKSNSNDPRDTLQQFLQEQQSNESCRRLNFCDEFDYQMKEGQHRHSFEMQRYYLKNTIYFNQVSLNPKMRRSVEKLLSLTLSVYKGNSSVWGYGTDHLHFATDALKSITFESSLPNHNPKPIENLQNAVCRIKFEDVYKHVYQAISDNCLDLADLPKCAFYLFEDGFFYMIDKMESTLREIRPWKVCHLLILSSSFLLNRAKSPEGMVVMICAGKIDPSDSVWIPFLGSQDSTLYDIIEHIMKHFVGDHKRKIRAQSGIRKTTQDIVFSFGEILERLRFSICKETSTTKLDQYWKALEDTFHISDLNRAPEITLKSILGVLAKHDPKGKQKIGDPTPHQHTRVSLICTFNSKFCTKKDDVFQNFMMGAESQIIFDRATCQEKINKQGYIKPQEVVESNDTFLARYQPVKEIKLFPKPCDFIQAMLRYDSKARLFSGDQSSQVIPPGYWPKENDSTLTNEAAAALVAKIGQMGAGSQTMATSMSLGSPKPSTIEQPTETDKIQKQLLPTLFLPNLYLIDITGVDCIDGFSAFDLSDLSYLEEEDGIFVSVRYRPIGMIFKVEKTLETDRTKIKQYFNVLEICTDTLEALQNQDVKLFGDIFVRECIRSKIFTPEPPKTDPKTGQPLPDQPEQKIDPQDISLDEIQKSRLVTYYKYHGSTFDSKKGNLERKPMQYLLFSEINLNAEGPIKTILLERLPVR